MELGFIANGSPSDIELAEAIGYTTLELAFFPGTDKLTFAGKDTFAHALKNSTIKVSAISMYGDPHPLSSNASEAQASEDRFSALIDIAVELDAPVVYCGSGGEDTAEPTQIAKQIIDVFGKRAEKVKSAGKSFAFYNCHWSNIVDRPSMWKLILPYIDAGIKFDPSHPAYDGRDYLAELEEWGKYVRHTHAKDFLKIGDHMYPDPNPGFGQIQWGPFFTLLYEAGFSGSVTVEPHSRLWTQEKRTAGLKATYRFLSQFILE
jgi:sugar phosphate isomerase/epimerase